MSLKVCHVTSAHTRYDIRIVEKECVSLANNGYDTILIVNDNKMDENYKGVSIVTTGLKPKNRMQRMLLSMFRLKKKMNEVDADVYHLHDPELLLIASWLKRKNKKVIFDSHEDVPQQIKDKIWIPSVVRKPIAFIYEKYEKKILSNIDAVISVTPHIVHRLVQINSNSFMITNYPRIKDKENANVNRKRNLQRVICFAGGISEQWNHEIILDAICDLDDIKFILAGKGSTEYLDRLRSHKSWNKVDYRGQIPFEEVKDIYSVSSIGLALNYSVQAGEEGTLGNTKLFEYMQAGVPIICSNYRLWKEIVEDNGCGICVDPKDKESIKSAIVYLLDNPEEAQKMGNNGMGISRLKYNWDTQEKELLKLYVSLLNS